MSYWYNLVFTSPSIVTEQNFAIHNYHIWQLKVLKFRSVNVLGKKTGAQNIVQEIKQYQKKWLQHVQRMDTNRLPKQALQYKPKGRRNIGRPRKRRRDQLHLHPSGIWWWWWWWWWKFRSFSRINAVADSLFEHSLCCKIHSHSYSAGRFQWPRGLMFDLRPLACWNCGFESRLRHGCLSVVNVVCCQVEASAPDWSPVQRSPTACG